MISFSTISQSNLRNLLVLVFIAITTVLSFSQNLVINEFIASNGTGIIDEFGENEDWVEIYNPGTTAIDIGGMYFTDDLAEPTLWQIPTTAPDSTTIPPQGFLIVWFDKDTEQGVLHVKAKLSTSGEQIGLFASDGITPIDTLSFGAQLEDISYGRTIDGGDEWRFFNTPTPNESNGNAPNEDFAVAPIASIEGGFYNDTISVVLSTETPNATIYYTTDGSQPDNTDTEYTGPIAINQTTTLRATTIAPGYLTSVTTTHTYFFNISHTFPVVALSFEPDDFFDDSTGIYTNYDENWERPVNVEFFESDGSLAFNQAANAEIHGSASASQRQKSIALKSKSSAGAGTFDYPIFSDMEDNSYQRFIIRDSGQDFPYTSFKDAMASSLVRDLTDVDGKIERPRLNLQGYRPGVGYFNGEYWGIYNIRERIDKKYFKQHFGLSSSELDFLDQQNEVKAGDLVLWNEFMSFLDNNDMSDDTNFNQLTTMLDVDEYMDYIIFDLFIDNWDWPANNVKRWRPRAEGGKWRYVITDLDFSFGMYNPWNSGVNTHNSLERLFNDEGWNWPNAEWATRPFRKCVENEGWRNDFINRMADQLNILYSTDRIIQRINDFETTYQPERQKHVCRWFDCWDGSTQNIEILRTFANGRDNVVRQHFVEKFDIINGTTNITISAVPATGGSVSINTVHLSETDYPWNGIYFSGIDIPINAEPARGYFFDHWSGANTGNVADSTINLQTAATLTAHFRQGSTSTIPVTINEINYHSSDAADSGDWVELYNPSAEDVNLSGWSFEDESGNYFQIPVGTILPSDKYLVLAKDLADFQTIYPAVINVIGSFGDGDNGFKLSNKDEKISLLNAAGVEIDTVHYYDSEPWPEAADGDGPSLQLTDAASDNALAINWFAEIPTPGKENTVSNNGCPTAIAGFSFLGEYNDHHYFLSENVSQWDDAQTEVTNHDGYLVTINNENENNFLKDNVAEIVLIGLNDVETEGDLVWQNGDPIGYTHFSNCEFCGLNTENNDYGVMNNWDGSWSFISSFVLKKFIMEVGCGTETIDTMTLTCPDNMVIEPVNEGFVNLIWEEPITTSTCVGGISLTQTSGPELGFQTSSGIYDIAYTASDSCGNTATCAFTIDVITAYVTPLCPDSITTIAISDAGAVIDYQEPTFETNLPADANVEINLVGGLPSGSLFPVGTTEVQYQFVFTAYDIIDTCSFAVTVEEPLVQTGCSNIEGFTKLGEYHNHGYYLSETGAHWTEAKIISENNGGYLATMNNQSENDFLQSNLDYNMVFIGYNDAELEGIGQWANDDPVTLNLSYDNNESADFGVMNFWDGRWVMVNKYVVKPFILEKTCGDTVITTCPVDFIFNNQQQIDEFPFNHPNCIDIEGSVRIISSEEEPITNLAALSQIQSIGGNLYISFTNIPNLSGLDNLTSIEGNFSLYSNNTITNFSGLNNLTAIGGYLVVEGNGQLENFSGFDNLISISGLHIGVTSSLTNLSGLDNLTTISDNIFFYGNTALENITALENVTSTVNEIYINSNPNLTSLIGLKNINPSNIQQLTITQNINLSECAIQPICDYLNLPTANTDINNNAVGCNSSAEIELACGAGGCSEIEDFTMLGEFNNHGYYLSNAKPTWPVAKAIAISKGGYLVSINDQAENDFVSDNVNIRVFIGINDEAVEGDIVWANGDDLIYTNYGLCSICGQNTERNDYGILNSWDNSWGLVNQYTRKYFVMEKQCGNHLEARFSSAILELETIENNGAVQLYWTNNTGNLNDKFILEKSVDGVEFYEFSEVKSFDSHTMKVYNDWDKNPIIGDNYYRIKVLFKDGGHKYSDISKIEFKMDVNAIGLYPNPATNQVYLHLKPHAGQRGDVLIFNTLGVLVQQYHFDRIPEEPFTIDVTEYNNGLYFFKIKVDGYRQQTIRLAVQSTR